MNFQTQHFKGKTLLCIFFPWCMMEPQVDVGMQNAQISVWMQTRRKKWQPQPAQAREKPLENAKWLKKAVFGKKKKKNNQKPRSHKSERLLITHKASRNVCQHVHLCTHPCTHQLHKYKHTELLPTAMLFLFFNATVFFNSGFFLSKIAIKNSNTIRILFFCADKKQMLEIYSSTLQFLIRLGFQQV